MSRHGEKVAGILLAAGASTRMGSPKQLLPVKGGTLLGRLLDEVLDSDLDKVILVLGHKAAEIKRALGETLTHPKLAVIENRRHEEGISTSIIAGLSEVEESHLHVMILLGDMPSVTSNLINHLLKKFLDSHLSIGAIQIKGRRSHPVIFSRQLYNELHSLRGDLGARSLFQKHSDRVCLIDPEGPYDDRDIDTQKDYIELNNQKN